ncbi:CU044_5270 family protein [Actinosynnema sp. CS-041913]|uniref:CU044_5270 family protein n=1 Tax=Actinosynnema sp. CS-041913 TaxID=3239917 RepID=UPI003D9334F2
MRDLDDALDQLNHAARHSDAPLGDVRARVLAAAAAEESPRRAHRSRRWFLPVAAAAAAALIAGTVVTRGEPAPQPSTGGTQALPGATTSVVPDVTLLSAREMLNNAADAIKTVDPQLAPGQYRYIAEHAWYSRGVQHGVSVDAPDQTIKGYTYLKETAREVWIPQDQTQDWLEKRSWLPGVRWLGGSIPQSEADEPRAMDTDTGERRGKCGDFFPKSQPRKVCGDPTDWDSPEFYTALPRDPEAIVEYLREATAHRGSAPATMFHWGVEILRAGLMPADLRASWYRALALLDGVTVYDAAVTLDGRTGTAIGIEDVHERRDLIVDPATGEFIGERTVAGPQPHDAWITPGTVTGFSSITTKVVNSLGETG